MHEYLSVNQNSQGDKHDERDEAMDNEVEVDEIILYIVRLKT